MAALLWWIIYDNNTSILGNTLTRTHDGNYVFVGMTDSYDGDVMGAHGAGDIWVVKYSLTGEIIWQKCLGGKAIETPYCIKPTNDGGYIICGFTSSKDGDIIGSHGEKADAWIIKIDSVGHIDWQHCSGGTGEDFFNSVIQTADGGFIAAGKTNTNDEGFFLHNIVYWDAFIVKFDSNGNELWHELLGGSNFDLANSILETSDRGYIFVGSVSSSDGDVLDRHAPQTANPDVWLVKLDTSGKILWQKCYGGSLSDAGNNIIATNDGGYAIIGITNSHDGDVSGYHGDQNLKPSPTDDGWVIKVDSIGNIQWQKCIGGSGLEFLTSIIQTADSGYAFAGFTKSKDGEVIGMHITEKDSSDAWVGGISTTGELLWQKCLGGTGTDEAYSILQAPDNGFMVYGKTISFNGDVVGNHGASDVWVVKLTAPKNGVEIASGQSQFSNPYPNPSQNEVNIALYRSMQLKQIQFFNVMGQPFYPDYRIDNGTAVINTANLPNGVYTIRVNYTDKSREVLQIRKFLHIATE